MFKSELVDERKNTKKASSVRSFRKSRDPLRKFSEQSPRDGKEAGNAVLNARAIISRKEKTARERIRDVTRPIGRPGEKRAAAHIPTARNAAGAFTFVCAFTFGPDGFYPVGTSTRVPCGCRALGLVLPPELGGGSAASAAPRTAVSLAVCLAAAAAAAAAGRRFFSSFRTCTRTVFLFFVY